MDNVNYFNRGDMTVELLTIIFVILLFALLFEWGALAINETSNHLTNSYDPIKENKLKKEYSNG